MSRDRQDRAVSLSKGTNAHPLCILFEPINRYKRIGAMIFFFLSRKIVLIWEVFTSSAADFGRTF